MECRYLNKHELSIIFHKDEFPNDTKGGQAVGVSECCDLSLIIESGKINSVSEQTLLENYANVVNGMAKGLIWMLELTSENLSAMLLDESFFREHCDKKGNPYVLTQRISLFFDSRYSYWSENVYLEAFEND